MSVDSFLLLRDERLPDCAALQAAVSRIDTGIVLDDVGNMRKHTGFWPVDLKGQESGFEWYYGTVAETFAENPAWAVGYAHVVRFRTFSEIHELVSAMYVAGALASLADGRFYDEESNELLGSEEILRLASALEETQL